MNRDKTLRTSTDANQQYHQKLMLELTETDELLARLSETGKEYTVFINQIKQKRHYVESALLRFQDGAYGTCLSCGSGISPKRLAVLPYAERCLHCQQKKEIGSL